MAAAGDDRIEVASAGATLPDSYERFLARDPDNLIYSSPQFLAFLRAATGAEIEVLIAHRGDAIAGALPFAVLEHPGVGRVVNSLPWWGSHGSIVLDRSDPGAPAVREPLLRAFAARIKMIDPLATTVVLLPGEQSARDQYEAILKPTASDYRIGQISDLPADGRDLEDRLLAGFAQKTRNLVRKSLRQGFDEVVSDEPWAWDFLRAAHVANLAALGGRPKPREHFAAIRDAFPACMRRLAIAMDGTTPVAAMLTLTFNGTVEYITPAIEVAYRPRQPLSFLIVKGMLDAIRGGARRWNWGGTWVGQHDLHHFKAGFGATDRPYSYLVRASEHGLRVMRERKAELATLFPYFYCYSYGDLG